MLLKTQCAGMERLLEVKVFLPCCYTACEKAGLGLEASCGAGAGTGVLGLLGVV